MELPEKAVIRKLISMELPDKNNVGVALCYAGSARKILGISFGLVSRISGNQLPEERFEE